MAKAIGTKNKKVRKDKGTHRTHCKRGHEFTPENTFITKKGHYRCRICIQLNRDTCAWDQKAYDKEKNLRERGWTGESFDKAFKEQEGKCAICGKEMNLNKKTNPDRACADHDHETGISRGVLCAACNFGLGCLQDKLDVLEKATEYLRKYKCPPSFVMTPL